jgi:hypothetical protein
MQNKLSIALTISILSIIFSSCKKETFTTTSNFLFSAKVDGIFLSADSAEGFLHIDTSSNFTMRTFMVVGFFHKKTITAFSIDTLNSFNLLNSNYSGWGGKTLEMVDSITGNVYNSNPINSALFNITYNDTVNMLVSGNFSGYILDSASTDSIMISNGSFSNVKYFY